MPNVIDLGFRNGGLGTALSNLFHYPFVIDDVQCGGIEGFLQSLKQKGLEEQEMIAGLHGYEAYKVGQIGNDWKETQTLYWRGKKHLRFSKKYHVLLERGYDACFDQNETFRKALYETGVAILTHKTGKHNPTTTTLTEWEYIYNMYRLRARAHQEI